MHELKQTSWGNVALIWAKINLKKKVYSVSRPAVTWMKLLVPLNQTPGLMTAWFSVCACGGGRTDCLLEQKIDLLIHCNAANVCFVSVQLPLTCTFFFPFNLRVSLTFKAHSVLILLSMASISFYHKLLHRRGRTNGLEKDNLAIIQINSHSEKADKYAA